VSDLEIWKQELIKRLRKQGKLMPPEDSGELNVQALIIKKLDNLDEKVTNLRVEVAKLKVKASVWGGVGGVITAVGILLWKVLTG
jgi:hypothetical protein